MIEGLVYIFITYLVASVPTGPILSSLYADVDVTRHGSGNIGATNVHRVLGPRFGIATLLGDLLKGLFPVLLAPLVTDHVWFPPAVGIVAFAGHCWPAYLEFRGGKGVATIAGVLIGLSPLVALFASIAWMVTFLAFKRSSGAAIAAAVVVPPLMMAITPAIAWSGVVLSAGMIQRHRENIRRMMSGEEPPTNSR